MSEHPEFWYILTAIGGGLFALIFKMAFEWLKTKSGGDLSKVILDRVNRIDNRTMLMDKNLDDGVAVAKRNTDSYHEFLIVLNDLKNMIGNNTKVTEELVQEVKTQTEVFNKVLIEIKRNGNGHK